MGCRRITSTANTGSSRVDLRPKAVDDPTTYAADGNTTLPPPLADAAMMPGAPTARGAGRRGLRALFNPRILQSRDERMAVLRRFRQESARRGPAASAGVAPPATTSSEADVGRSPTRPHEPGTTRAVGGPTTTGGA